MSWNLDRKWRRRIQRVLESSWISKPYKQVGSSQLRHDNILYDINGKILVFNEFTIKYVKLLIIKISYKRENWNWKASLYSASVLSFTIRIYRIVGLRLSNYICRLTRHFAVFGFSMPTLIQFNGQSMYLRIVRKPIPPLIL